MDGMDSTSGREMRISCSLSGKSEGIEPLRIFMHTSEGNIKNGS